MERTEIIANWQKEEAELRQDLEAALADRDEAQRIVDELDEPRRRLERAGEKLATASAILRGARETARQAMIDASPAFLEDAIKQMAAEQTSAEQRAAAGGIYAVAPQHREALTARADRCRLAIQQLEALRFEAGDIAPKVRAVLVGVGQGEVAAVDAIIPPTVTNEPKKKKAAPREEGVFLGESGRYATPRTSTFIG